jgi:hypothetical protein
MKKFCIYTARKNRAQVRSWLLLLQLGYTLFDAVGGWPESAKAYVAEDSMMIEIIGKVALKHKIKLLCCAIKGMNKQKEILVTVEDCPSPWSI